ncbi:MAG: hypothetical protein ABI402_03565 [Ferruginibacter sp.]
MQEEILFSIPHVKLIHSKSGLYCLIVEDGNVNDYVEDFLWDQFEYESTSVSVPAKNSPVIYYNCFERNFTPGGLLEELKKLDAGEVERIYSQKH